MAQYRKPARGKARLTQLAALPCLDTGSEVRYYGSISKCGDNSDWDWGMYQDEKGEWVLAEADGPGCIFNFTQHRYPTSPVPTFRFYFDHSREPQFELTPADFGRKAPFLRPLADIFEGPEDNGRGPIWVVRSFVPMEFRTHCKVTCTIRLEGPHKHLNQGGWGHVTMHLYDSAEGLSTFSAEESTRELAELYCRPLALPCQDTRSCSPVLQPGERRVVYAADKAATLTGIGAELAAFAPEMLQDLWVRLTFDGKETVTAPFGTFFGCEYGKLAARLDTALLTWDITGETARFENRYPMPFFAGASVELENRGERPVRFAGFTVKENTELRYDPDTVGYFAASDYYPKTPNVMGENSLIAEVSGSGQMVYGVVSGEDIHCAGCEGDVRVFLDGLCSPAVESDGSESWASYGWGFVVPPQCNPFSAYNGVPDINDTWSELRLTFTDCYPFRSKLRFELEHGCQNDGGGCHSGQVFCYLRPEAKEQFAGEFVPGKPGFASDGETEEITDRFENGIHEHDATFTRERGMTCSRFTVELPEENDGLVLKRVSTQEEARMEAAVYVDGAEVTERHWLYPDYNDCYRLLEDTFTVPASYTNGKQSVTVEIRPLDSHWNQCRYLAFVRTK